MCMAKFPLTHTHQSSGKVTNLHSLSPTHDSEIGYSSPPRCEHEILYQHLHSICIITHHFAKAIRLIPGIKDLPYASRNPNTITTGIVVSSMEEVVLATLEGLEEAVENREEPLILQ